MHRRLLISLIAVSLGAFAPAAASARDITVFDGAEGRIAYVDVSLGGDIVIASMAKDGTDPRMLTTSAQSPYGDFDPVWSPGGKFIVFTRYNASFTGEIWRMNADGSGQKRLTNNAADDAYGGWSADGSRIVFASDRAGNYEIYSMDLDGGTVKRLTTNAADDLDPTWSPDNTRIAFSSDRDDTREIYTMKADGSQVTKRTNVGPTELDIAPDWSPDNARLTFTRIDSSDDSDIKIVDLSTGVVSAVTNDDAGDVYSVFSPDVAAAYSRVIYQSFDVNTGAEDVVLWDSGTSTSLTDTHDGDQYQPDWQPIPAFPLVDARFSTFKLDIEWVYGEGITVGCSAERYCPNDTVSRGQMATFLVRALGLPATATDYFTDDETSSHEQNINRVRAAGITSGCTATTYCPDADVTREQMATFLAKGFALPATATDYFTDDETSSHEANINKVKAAGITSGCTPTTYCPKAVVTRGQMAAFLRRALE